MALEEHLRMSFDGNQTSVEEAKDGGEKEPELVCEDLG